MCCETLPWKNALLRCNRNCLFTLTHTAVKTSRIAVSGVTNSGIWVSDRENFINQYYSWYRFPGFHLNLLRYEKQFRGTIRFWKGFRNGKLFIVLKLTFTFEHLYDFLWLMFSTYDLKLHHRNKLVWIVRMFGTTRYRVRNIHKLTKDMVLLYSDHPQVDHNMSRAKQHFLHFE